MRYVIAYDIPDDGRRNRIARFLEGWGRRVQKSVFECDLSAQELEQVLGQLRAWLVLAKDRCHVYRLCGECIPHQVALGEDLEALWPDVMTL